MTVHISVCSPRFVSVRKIHADDECVEADCIRCPPSHVTALRLLPIYCMDVVFWPLFTY